MIMNTIKKNLFRVLQLSDTIKLKGIFKWYLDGEFNRYLRKIFITISLIMLSNTLLNTLLSFNFLF